VICGIRRQLTVIQDDRLHLLIFHVFDPECDVRYTREFNEVEVHALLPQKEQWKISMGAAAEDLAKRLTLVRNCRHTKIAFTGDPAEGGSLPVYQGTVRVGENHLIVEVVKDDRETEKESSLLLFKVYDPLSGDTYSMSHQMPVASVQPSSIKKLLDELKFETTSKGQTLKLNEKSLLRRRLLDAQQMDSSVSTALDTPSQPVPNMDLVHAREELWRLRRDQAFRARREEKQPLAVVYRQGLKLNGEHYIISLKVGPACINGEMHWSVYNLQDSAEYTLLGTWSSMIYRA
jgi:hypothetical protein